MYRLCLENLITKNIFYERINSPYLLNKRLNALKRSKKIKIKYMIKEC